MKTIDISQERQFGTNDIAMREVETLRKRKHDCVVEAVLSFTRYWRSTPNSHHSQKRLAIIFPWYPSSLSKILLQPSPWLCTKDENSRRNHLYEYVFQVLQGLAHLHNPHEDGCWTSHHDLKPTNILIKEDRAVLADLGKARLIHALEGSTASSTRSLGTTDYCPPENFNEDGSRCRKGHGRDFDMWSMGCVMIEVAMRICFGWGKAETSVQQFRKECEKLTSTRRPFPNHVTSSGGEVGRAYYNSIYVIDEWLMKLQKHSSEDHVEAQKLKKYLRLAVSMLRREPTARVYSWEAVLDYYDLLHPDAGQVELYQKAKEFIQAPRKTKNPLADTPLYRAAEYGNYLRVLCLADPTGARWPVGAKDINGKTQLILRDHEGTFISTRGCYISQERPSICKQVYSKASTSMSLNPKVAVYALLIGLGHSNTA